MDKAGLAFPEEQGQPRPTHGPALSLGMEVPDEVPGGGRRTEQPPPLGEVGTEE